MNKFSNAQSLLMSRAALLLQLGGIKSVYTNCYPSLGHMTFRGYRDEADTIEVSFDDEKPFDQSIVDAALEQMDIMVAAERKRAERNLALIKSWEG